MEPNSISKPKYVKPKPKIFVDAEDLPAIKDWNVGDTYTIQAKVKLVFQSEGNEYESEYVYPGEEAPKNKPMKATFKILSIEPIKEMKKVTKNKKAGKMLPRVKAK